MTSTVSIAVTMLLQISDAILSGAMIGEQTLAAINVVTPIYAAVIFLSYLIAAGTSIMFGNAAGAFDKEKMTDYFSEGLIFAIILGVFIGFVTTFGKDLYFDYYNLSDSVLNYTYEYFMYYKFVFILMPLFAYLADMVYVDGDELICNISYLVNAVTNIGLSVVLCNAWGIRGIGFGTFAGMLLSCIVLCFHFVRKSNSIRFRFYTNLKDIPCILKYSFIDASAYLYFAIVSVWMNKFIITHFGEMYLPVYTAVFAVIEMEVILDGIGDAMYPLVNVYRGEKNQSGEKNVLKYSMIYAILEGVTLSLLFFILAPFLTKFAFGINTPGIYELSVNAVRIVSLRITATSLLFAVSSYYLVSDHIVLGSVMVCLYIALVPIFVGIVLAAFFGMTGLWVGIALAPLLSILIIMAYICLRYGKSKMPFILSEYDVKSFTYDITLTEENVMQLCDAIRNKLINENIEKRIQLKPVVLCEDYLLLVAEKNGNKALDIECSLLIGDYIELIFRDTGKLLDITDADLKITSLRSMVVSCLANRINNKDYLLTTSYNRSVFRFEKNYSGSE